MPDYPPRVQQQLDALNCLEDDCRHLRVVIGREWLTGKLEPAARKYAEKQFIATVADVRRALWPEETPSCP
jgi:hypothetical protein